MIKTSSIKLINLTEPVLLFYGTVERVLGWNYYAFFLLTLALELFKVHL